MLVKQPSFSWCFWLFTALTLISSTRYNLQLGRFVTFSDVGKWRNLLTWPRRFDESQVQSLVNPEIFFINLGQNPKLTRLLIPASFALRCVSILCLCLVLLSQRTDRKNSLLCFNLCFALYIYQLLLFTVSHSSATKNHAIKGERVEKLVRHFLSIYRWDAFNPWLMEGLTIEDWLVGSVWPGEPGRGWKPPLPLGE